MMVGMENADIILVPEFRVMFHGEKSVVTHIIESLEKNISLVIMVCLGVKQNICDDEELKNSNKSITEIIVDQIKAQVKSHKNEDLKENLNFKLFNLDLIICTDTNVTNSDVVLADSLSRWAINEMFSDNN